jgi:hypothetical protein
MIYEAGSRVGSTLHPGRGTLDQFDAGGTLAWVEWDSGFRDAYLLDFLRPLDAIETLAELA